MCVHMYNIIMYMYSLAHAALDAESEILCHESSLDSLNAYSFKIVSKCGKILVV